MTASRNVFSNVFHYSNTKDVYGVVREWPVVMTESPAGGWAVRVGQRVWYPETSLTVFQAQKSQRVWVPE